MRAVLTGEIVETERKPWTMNGNSGVSYNLYLRNGSAREGAQRVKVSAEQFGGFHEGQEVELPVDIYARASDFGGPARLDVVLERDYLQAAHGAGPRPVPAAAAN